MDRLNSTSNIDLLFSKIHTVIKMIPERLKSIIAKGILSIMHDSLDVYNNIAYIQTLHQQTFGEYYNCNQGKEVVIVASGPTVNKYEPIPGAIHIGVNNTYKLKDKIPFKYMFMQDYGGGNTIIGRQMLNGVLSVNCTKFIGKYINDSMDFSKMTPPEGLLANSDAKRYFSHPTVSIKSIEKLRIYPDIRYHNLIDFGTVVHPAIHFALFTNPKKIYLVGCDTSSAGHFDVNNKAKDTLMNQKYLAQLKAGYLRIKDFAMYHYPDTEIISINPVGLKGLFSDEYYQP